MKASICLSTYNKAGHLQKTLESIFEQHPPFEWEVIVCDDGSTDHTHDVCRDYPVEYRHLNRPGYQNPAAARNVAYRAARGEVVICQSDDVLHSAPDTIERLVGDLRQGRFLLASVINVDEDGKPYRDPHGKGWGDGLLVYVSPKRQRPLFFLGSLYRRDLYSVGGNDEEFVDPGYDDDWFAACLIYGRGLWAEYSGEIMGYHQHHPHTEQWAGTARSKALLERKTVAAQGGAARWASTGGAWEYEDETVSDTMPKSKYHYVFWHKSAGQWIVKFHERNNPSGKETIDIAYFPLDQEDIAGRVADLGAYYVCANPKYNFPLVDNRPVGPPSWPESRMVDLLLGKRVIRPVE